MAHEAQYAGSDIYFIACNPLVDVYHIGTVQSGQEMATGQPLLITGGVRADVYDLVYSAYDLDSDDYPIDESYHDVTWSVGYGLAEANTTIGTFNLLLPDIYIYAIKHPDRDEWALPWSDHIFSTAPAGALKDTIAAKHAETIGEGNSKTKSFMITDGWIS
jgi:hypothetical protein